MKTKKTGIAVLSAVIVVIAIIIAVCSPAVHTGFGNLGVNGLTGKDIQNSDSVVLLAHSAEIGGIANSAAGVKEAVRLGASGVCVDLCFRTDGTPVITDSYDNVDSAPTVEELFKEMSAERYKDIKLYFNIVQLSDLSELNRLAVEYNMISRLTLIGIDTAHYGMITTDDTIIPFYLTYDVTSADTSAIGSGTFTVPSAVGEYGASGIVIDRSDCSEKTMNAFADYGVPVIVTGINSGNQLCSALLDGAQTVYVTNIQNSAKIYSGWISHMQERFESSVAQSLEDLSTTE